MKILIVDDQQENLIFLETLLKGFEHQVSRATNGKEALEKLRQDKYEMIITDILMPIMDGYQLCQHVKSDEQLKDILFIFYTATYVEKEDEVLAYKLGADKFLIKPMAPEKLIKIIHQVVQESQKKKIKSDQKQPVQDEEIFKLYNERLIRKLEKKMMDLEKEVADRKKAEAALRQSEEMFRKAFEYATIGKAMAYPSGQFVKVNQSFSQMLGYTQKELLKKNWQDVTHPQFLSESSEKVQELLSGQVPSYTTEQQFIHKNGKSIWIRMNIVLVKDLDDHPLYLVEDIENITERKQAEMQIQNDLKEKEILLKEIHHRVKNNLQIIHSLLHLQTTTITDADVNEKLNECRNRVRAIALVHEKLYQSESFIHIDFATYIHKLVTELNQAYNLREQEINIKVNVKDVRLPLDYAVPCGLVISELVSNAFKHAFPESLKKNGIIEIVLIQKKTQDVEMTIKDNGIGLSEDIDLKKTKSLGLHLVKILIEDQLNGSLNVTRDSGTEFRIGFKIET